MENTAIDPEKIPAHVAVIMDGNGRWAKQQGSLTRVFGHQNAVKAVREITEGAKEIGIKYLTLFAFSTENWNRPEQEIHALMSLLVSTIRSELDELMKNEVKIVVIGDTSSLPAICQEQLAEAVAKTSHNTSLTVVLALSYSGRWDIAEAVRKIGTEIKEGRLEPSGVNAATIERHLSTAGIPEPELLVRTSGEMRISNFLLWQLAYTELYFTGVLWPDFRKEHLYEAVSAYQQRERRFGKTSEQIAQNPSTQRTA